MIVPMMRFPPRKYMAMLDGGDVFEEIKSINVRPENRALVERQVCHYIECYFLDHSE